MLNRPEYGAECEPMLFLDISGDVCPLTFVRTKLLIEGMKPGETAEIRLQGSEPLRNVPRAVIGLGHTVLSLQPEAETPHAEGVHRLRIRKNAK